MANTKKYFSEAERKAARKEKSKIYRNSPEQVARRQDPEAKAKNAERHRELYSLGDMSLVSDMQKKHLGLMGYTADQITLLDSYKALCRIAEGIRKYKTVKISGVRISTRMSK